MERPVIHHGLDDVYVDETSISEVDGEAGTLIYRDHAIEDLVHRDFVDVAHLVIFGQFPNEQQKHGLELILAANGDLSSGETEILKSIPQATHPMKVIQALVPILDLNDRGGSRDFETEVRRGLVLAAKIPGIIANYHRIRGGEEVLPGKIGLHFHENFLYRFTGIVPSRAQARVFDVTQILQMEHGFNASTFAARVTASTLAPIECAVSAAIGTLYGKLHGGADQEALEMGLRLGSPDRASAFVLKALEEKEKIMGMGHRIYRVVDPRAKILKPLARSLCDSTPYMNLYLTLEKIEEVMELEMAKRGKRVKANVEFYKGPVFYALGIPPEYFTALFAMSRVFGYVAHVLESRRNNRLIRPRALYVPA